MAMQGRKGSKHTLVATLGRQPQIVTFTLDLLLQRDIPISEVVVVHPASSPDLQKSLQLLNAEFVGGRYAFAGRDLTMHFRQQVLNYYGTIIDDIIDEKTATGTLNTIGELIRDLKQQGHIIHFSISGGRRLMTFLSFSAAVLYFETSDELLHLYTPEHAKVDIVRNPTMHLPPGNGQCLIEVPFARAAHPFLARQLNSTPAETIHKQRERRKAEEHDRCEQVVKALNDKQHQILRALAQGLHPHEVAKELGIKQSTMSTYTNVIYQLCRSAWDLSDKVQVNYLFIQARFVDYFSDEEIISSGWEEENQTGL